MTPLHIQLMLHYYAIDEPYAKGDPAHANSDAVRKYRAFLIGENMICPSSSSGSGYEATDRGRAYVEALCAVQLPIIKWVQP